MDNDDQIGYGKPPRHTQFRRGFSGNPRGRPRRSESLATVLAKALRARTVVNEDGRLRKMSKLDAAVSQLVNKATSGDLAALRQLMALAGSIEDQPTGSGERQLMDVDEKVMRDVLKRLKSCSEEGKSEG